MMHAGSCGGRRPGRSPGGDRCAWPGTVPFDGWVAVRGPALLRLAYTLTGNTADAEDVVQEALARALPRWERISRVDNVDAYVRRMVVNAHTSWWRKFRRRESPVAELRDTVVEGPGVGFDDHRRIWLACQALPGVAAHRDRAALLRAAGVRRDRRADRRPRGVGPRAGVPRAGALRRAWASRWEKQMSDLEQRLADALTEGAQGAPVRTRPGRGRAVAGPDAGAATGSSGRPRVVALAVGVPTVRRWPPGGSDDGPTDPATGRRPDPDDHRARKRARRRYRVESWHDVTHPGARRPGGTAAWSAWCAGGGSLDTPRVSRPGDVSETIACSPALGYGITFQEIDNTDDFQWPVVQQDPDAGWPPERLRRRPRHRWRAGRWSPRRRRRPGRGACSPPCDAIGRAATPTAARSTLRPDPATSPEGAMAVCRYDDDGAARAERAAAPGDGRRRDARTRPCRRADRRRARVPAPTPSQDGSSRTQVVGLSSGDLGHGRPRERLSARDRGRPGPRADRRRPLLGTFPRLERFRSGRRLTTV